MENQQKNYNSLSDSEKIKYKKELEESKEILTLQADIAKARSDIKEYQLRELVAVLKLYEIQNPKEIEVKDKEDGENS
jgi:hypothetical protein